MSNVRDLVLVEDHLEQFFVVDAAANDDEAAVEHTRRIPSFEQFDVALLDDRRVVVIEVVQENHTASAETEKTVNQMATDKASA